MLRYNGLSKPYHGLGGAYFSPDVCSWRESGSICDGVHTIWKSRFNAQFVHFRNANHKSKVVWNHL